MSTSKYKRRLAENEAVFRQWNKMVHGLNIDSGTLNIGRKTKLATFICECADEDCSSKIKMDAKEYSEIHKSSDRFVVIPGHQVVSVEKVLLEQPNYMVVQKYITPPKIGAKLHNTNLNNS